MGDEIGLPMQIFEKLLRKNVKLYTQNGVPP